MYNNNTENTIYTLENPQFKQKLYELQLMMDQYQYSKKKKVLEDAKIVLENYKELNPTLTAINISILELQGKIICSFIFSSNKIQWSNLLYSLKILTLINLMQIHYINQLKSKMDYLLVLTILFSLPKIVIKIIKQLILCLKYNLPYLKIFHFSQKPSLTILILIRTIINYQLSKLIIIQQQLQLVVIIVQQSQFHQQQQQSPYNSYLNIYEKQQSQQLEQSENKQQQEQQEMANKLIQMGSSVFEFGKILFMSQEQNKEKIKTGVKQKVDIELLNQSKNSWNLLNNKNNQMII
ncbi:unnamed protein product [Paramecium pentaurelia]|uniref:Transmembrane protein n=1 Tax=Paramecium pentaurelia TaxID=43138 RepID=A0A8S1SSJ4_9CILI|nr:unnamed protein product [Paramecium pentaurelia]